MASRCRTIALGVLIAFLTCWCRADIPTEVVLRAKQATALVDVEEKHSISEGSAFCIDATGIFVTNARVVEAREIGGKVLLVLHSGEKDETKLSAHLVMVDAEADLAAKEGEFPSITVSTGHITAFRKVKGVLNAIQLDASLNPGNSG